MPHVEPINFRVGITGMWSSYIHNKEQGWFRERRPVTMRTKLHPGVQQVLQYFLFQREANPTNQPTKRP